MRLAAGPTLSRLLAALWLVALTGTVAADAPPEPASDNAELLSLYEADQTDRSGNMHEADWEAISRRDAERRERVMELVETGEAKTAADFYHAAMVFQHGEGVEDIRIARDWAARAVELSGEESEIHGRAKWLFAAATDRHLHRQGKPQIYGTQFIRDPNGGPWTMEPFDRDAVTPEKRAAHGVPPIEAQQERVDRMNEELRGRGLLEPGNPSQEPDTGDSESGS